MMGLSEKFLNDLSREFDSVVLRLPPHLRGALVSVVFDQSWEPRFDREGLVPSFDICGIHAVWIWMEFQRVTIVTPVVMQDS